MHHAAHGTESQEVRIGDAYIECFLDDMEEVFPSIYKTNITCMKKLCFFYYTIDLLCSIIYKAPFLPFE